MPLASYRDGRPTRYAGASFIFVPTAAGEAVAALERNFACIILGLYLIVIGFKGAMRIKNIQA